MARPARWPATRPRRDVSGTAAPRSCSSRRAPPAQEAMAMAMATAMDSDAEAPVRGSVFKEAIWNQYNVIAIGGMALFSLASESMVPLVLALGGEVLWLLVGPRTGRFRGWVASQERQDGERRWAAEIER